MRKSVSLLIILLVNSVVTVVFLIAWLMFDSYESESFPLILILLVSYLISISLTLNLIVLDMSLDKSGKLKWVLYCTFTWYVGCYHYYLLYKKDIDALINKENEKMRKGPDSLSEFNSRSDR
ncbi:MAG: hypothetical protein AAF391_02355 [Bacteroidota bacterium]